MDSESVARGGQPLPYTGRRRDWDRLRDQFSAALLSGDETGARRVFERLRLARVPLADQSEQVLVPAMRGIGDECEVGTISGLACESPPGSPSGPSPGRSPAWTTWPVGAPLAIVITPKGDDHRLPALMAATVLRDGDWAVRQIEGVDGAEVVAVARRLRPGSTVVSFALTDLGDAVAELAAQLADEVGVPVLVGGPGEPLSALQEQADALPRAGLSSL